MNSRVDFAFQSLRAGVLRVAALLVPPAERDEWLKEWRSELWHVCREYDERDAQPWKRQRTATLFCMGAFQDALCLRCYAWRQARFASVLGSPATCILALMVVLAACLCAANELRGVRMERSAAPYRAGNGLILIQDAERPDDALPTITQVQYRAWTRYRQQNFDGLAFYRVVREQANTDKASKAREWNVAHTSLNLFDLLRLPIQFNQQVPAGEAHTPAIVLSESGWRKWFGADEGIVGRVVRVGAREVRIAGVAPDGLSGLPGDVDAWLLEPEPRINSADPGYLVARLSTAGQAMMLRQRARIVAHWSKIAEDDLLGVSLPDRMPTARVIVFFPLLLAVLMLPLAMPISSYGILRDRLSLTQRLKGWSFLVAKIAIVISIAHYVSLDLAYGPTFLDLSTAVCVKMLSSFCIALLGLRWAFMDQQKRCPVCLRRVALPSRVGSASRTFLDWNGMEFLCVGGHALLHIPEMPTSWFSTPRWLLLDATWQFLFSDQRSETSVP